MKALERRKIVMQLMEDGKERRVADVAEALGWGRNISRLWLTHLVEDGELKVVSDPGRRDKVFQKV